MNKDRMILGYSRDKSGRHIESRHLKDDSNTLISTCGSAGSTQSQYVVELSVKMPRHRDDCSMVKLVGDTLNVSSSIADVQYPLNAVRLRTLTPREAFRLMGLRDDEIDKIQATGLSNIRQFKMAGNSIVVDVLAEIFRKLLVDTGNDDAQLTIFDAMD